MPADKKVSELGTLTDPASRDLVLVIDVPISGTNVPKQITLKNFFANVPANTSITGTFAVSGNTTHNGANNVFTYNVNINQLLRTNQLTITSNGFVISDQLTPAANTGVGISTGKIFFDSDYLYIKTANTTVKRIQLETF